MSRPVPRKPNPYHGRFVLKEPPSPGLSIGRLDLVVLQEAFTDPDATLLSAHTIAPFNPLGCNWSTSGSWQILSNQASPAFSGAAGWARVDLGKANARLTAELILGATPASTHLVGLVGRFYGAGENCWIMGLDKATGGIAIVEYVDAAYHVRAFTTAVPYEDYGEYLLEATFRLNRFQLTVNGVTISYVGSSDSNAATRFGLFYRDGGTPDEASYFDNLTIYV